MADRPRTGAERARACRARKRARVIARAIVDVTPAIHALLRDGGLLRSDGYAAAIERGLRALFHRQQADAICNGVTKIPTNPSRHYAQTPSAPSREHEE